MGSARAGGERWGGGAPVGVRWGWWGLGVYGFCFFVGDA